MKIAVTGGTGFIGQRLVVSLAASGHRVQVLTRSPGKHRALEGVAYFEGDLAAKPDLAAFVDGAEVLFHCAGEISNPSRMHTLHVEGTRHLIEAAAGKVAKWVQLSSTGAYGSKRAGQTLEDTALAPIGPYETTKVAADQLVWNAAGAGAFSCVILRPSIVFGSGMPNRSLRAMMRMIERSLFCFIGRPGSSANYIHVDNVVEALRRCAFRAESNGEVFNLSDHCTIEEFVHSMARHLGVDAPVRRIPEGMMRLLATVMQMVPGSPLTASRIDALTSMGTYPTHKIERLLGYRHVVSMEQGIADLVRDYRRGNT